MRIRKLILDRFGLFTDKVLDFGETFDGQPDFHVIYGSNEAGKTTLMEGYLRLLYGFPNQDPYSYKHERKNLKVTMRFDVNGQEHVLSRLPNKSASLVDENESSLSETGIQQYIAGLSQDNYRNLLCLNDDTIEKGGQDIVASRGETGRLLFSASAGLSDLSTKLASKSQDIDNLYKKRSTTSMFAVLHKELNNINEQIKEIDVNASEYKHRKKTAELKYYAEKNCKDVLEKLRRRKIELDALRDALPKLDKYDKLAEQILPLQHYPYMVNIENEMMDTLILNEATANANLKSANQQIKNLSEEIATIMINEDHLSISNELASIVKMRAKNMSADEDIDNRRIEEMQHMEKLKHEAKYFFQGKDSNLMLLILNEGQFSELEYAYNNIEKEQNWSEQATLESIKASKSNRHAEDEYDRLSESLLLDSTIPDLLDKYSADNLEVAYILACEKIETAKKELGNALENLTFKGQVFNKLPICTLDSSEIEKNVKNYEGIKGKIEDKKETFCEFNNNISILNKKIESLLLSRDVVSDGDAVESKHARDELWALHKESLSAKSAKEFSLSMLTHDQTMDNRVLYGKELGELRKLEADKIKLIAKSKGVEKNIQNMQEKLDELDVEFTHMSEGIGIKNVMNAETLMNWVKKYELAQQKHTDTDRLIAEHENITNKAMQLQNDLAKHFSFVNPTFEILITQSKKLKEILLHSKSELKSAKDAQINTNAEKQRRDDEKKLKDENLEDAKSSWVKLIEKHLPKGANADKLLVSFNSLRNVQNIGSELNSLHYRIAQMELNKNIFEKKIKELAIKFNVSDKADPEIIFTDLNEAGENAKTAFTKNHELSKTLDKQKTIAKNSNQELQFIQTNVIQYGEQFDNSIPTGSLTQLKEAFASAQRVSVLRTSQSELGDDICLRLGVDSVEASRERLVLSKLEIDVGLNEIEGSIISADNVYYETMQNRIAAVSLVDEIGGDDKVILLRQKKTTIELEIKELLTNYLEMKLGYVLAEKALTRYRDTHRSYMMQRSETIFSTLTDGKYSHLTSQSDGKKEILLAIDKNGVTKRADDLSKGTRFQLYLAFRGAAYEELISQNVNLPFFCDDIFETFDDERTRAACQIMESIGKKGQAIYLTHHLHVIDIAKQVCGDSVKIHKI